MKVHVSITRDHSPQASSSSPNPNSSRRKKDVAFPQIRSAGYQTRLLPPRPQHRFPYFPLPAASILPHPRDRRTGESREFSFVRHKYQDEAREAVDKLDGRVVDGREIMVQFAKYGPNAERIHRGTMVETSSKRRGRPRSRSPRGRYHNEYSDREYGRRSCSRSRDRYDCDRYRGRERDDHHRSMSRSISPDHHRHHGRNDQRGRSNGSASPPRHSPNSRSQSPHRTPHRIENPDGHNGNDDSPRPRSVSPLCRHADSQSMSPHRSNGDE